MKYLIAAFIGTAIGIAFGQEWLEQSGIGHSYTTAEVDAVSRLVAPLRFKDRGSAALAEVYGITSEADMKPINWKGQR